MLGHLTPQYLSWKRFQYHFPNFPLQESRTAAATTVDRLFNLGLTEVKEEAGDGSGLDVGARVVKTELVVLKGLDATVDDEEDDASSQAGLVHDHDPHDIGKT